MRRKIYIGLLVMACSLSAHAQIHRVGVGLSGGASTMFADSLTNLWGPSIGIEGYYACMFAINNSAFMLGPRTGLNASWSMSGWKKAVSGSFTNTDYLGNIIEYTVTGALEESHQHVNVGIPLMLAMKWHGLIAGVGAKASALLWSSSTTKLTDLSSSAYYPKFDVKVTDAPEMGVVSGVSQEVNGKRVTPEWHVAVAAELGYEFEVKKNQSLGIRIFADYDLWNSYRLPDDAAVRAVDISTIKEPKQVAEVVLSPLYRSELEKFKALNAGITISYIFDFVDTSHHCNCLPY